MKAVLKMVLLGLAGIAILALINLATIYLLDYYVVPHILVAIPIIYLPITIWRAIMLRFVPMIIINGTQIRYFNVLWYNTLQWADAVGGVYERPNNTLYLSTAAACIITADLDTISESDKNALLVDCKMALEQHNAGWQISETIIATAE